MAYQLHHAHVLVLGLGVSGQSAVRYLLNRGASVVGIDSHFEALEKTQEIIALCKDGLAAMSESDLCQVEEFDLVVASPGIPLSHPYLARAREACIPVIGEAELACSEIADSSSSKCVAITGTNGKTTVTTLVEHVLRASGLSVSAVGNIGTPLTSILCQNPPHVNEKLHIYVVELSSFQLETLKTPFIDAAVILNITPDHLDRHHSMREYAMAKAKIQELVTQKGCLFVEDRCYRDFSDLFHHDNLALYGYDAACFAYTDTYDVYIKGEIAFEVPQQHQGRQNHEIENTMAAYLLCRQCGVSSTAFIQALKSFKKPPHRIEFVRDVNGVRYYDDSKGTNIDAVIRAVDSLEGEIVLIAGGVDKGAPYTPWLQAFNGKVKGICAIGQAAPKIASDLQKSIPVVRCENLADAVEQARGLSGRKGIVLLSPGCSSYDMFKDYAHRGCEFQRIVNAL